uniref:Uncharacterized protein n=1 Tax=Rhizophora mucronata TaxID=61149 RepID=A0A2P2NUR3_RHIMU
MQAFCNLKFCLLVCRSAFGCTGCRGLC